MVTDFNTYLEEGGGSKIVQKIHTYFLNGTLHCFEQASQTKLRSKQGGIRFTPFILTLPNIKKIFSTSIFSIQSDNNVINTYFFHFQIKFHLGQTSETTHPETAVKIFLEREFPQLVKCQTEPHEAFLVPDSFVYGGIAAKVYLNSCLILN